MRYDTEAKEKMPSLAQMKSNMDVVMKYWTLGPEVASEEPTANKEFWKDVAVKWQVSEKEARRRNCGNCEYGRSNPRDLEAMDKYPFSKFDADGGGKVWCEKFDFVCHNLRVCQAWER